jgi:hypothetical protein
MKVKKLLLVTACLLALMVPAHATKDAAIDCDKEWTPKSSQAVKDYCEAVQNAELKANLLLWEKESRAEVPKTKPPVPAALELVRKANELLKGNPTCAQMRQASKLLERASDVYSKSNAKEAGDGTLRTLARRASWHQEVADMGECRK